MPRSYNGFDPRTRNHTWYIQLMLKEQKKLDWSRSRYSCELCGQGKQNSLTPHLEDYMQPDRFVTMCPECHCRLHDRSSEWDLWQKYLQAVLSGAYVPERHRNIKTFYTKKAEGNHRLLNLKIEGDTQSHLWWYQLRVVEPNYLAKRYGGISNIDARRKLTKQFPEVREWARRNNRTLHI